LSEVVKRATTSRVSQVNAELIALLSRADEELRDVYAIGVKTIINDANGPTVQVVANAVTEPLVEVLRSEDPGLVLQALDILAAVLQRAEVGVPAAHAKALLESFLAQLSSPEAAAKKKATVALGALSPHLGDDLLDTMVSSILATVGKGGSGAAKTTLVQVLGAVSRRVGWRLGRHLGDIVPVLASAVGGVDDESMESDDACELRETCLHALESLVLRCPGEVSPHLDVVERLSRDFIPYDPNYDYDGGADEEEDDDGYGDEYGDEDGYGGEDYNDEDDADDEASWKVRRAAARLLTAVVATRPERLRSYYEDGTAEEVLSHFRERDENVKLDVIACFTALLRSTITTEGGAPDTMPGGFAEAERTAAAAASATGAALGAAASGASGSLGAVRSSSLGASAGGGVVSSAPEVRQAAQAGLLQPPALSRQFSVAQDALPAMASEIVAAAAAQVAATKKGKGQRVKSAVLQLLRQLCLVLGEDAADQLGDIVAVALGALDESVAALRLEALETLRTALDTVPHAHWAPLLGEAVPAVAAAVGDDWYKCVAEALRVAGRLAVATRPVGGDAAPSSAAHVTALLSALESRLGESSADQEVKEAAILSSGLLLAYAGDTIEAGRVAAVQGVLLARMRNEVTRTCALKSIAFIASSPLAIDMTGILGDTVDEIASLLRQKSRGTRQAALACLDAVVSSRAKSLDAPQLVPAFTEAAAMVSDADLFLAHRALCAATSLATEAVPAVAAAVFSTTPFVQAAVTLASSPVVHGPALSALCRFLPAVATTGKAAGAAALSADALVASIAGPIGDDDSSSGAAAAASSSSAAADTHAGGRSSKQAIANAAACIAGLVASSGDDVIRREATAFLAAATDASTAPPRRLLSLYALGELGGAGADVLAMEAGCLDSVAGLFTGSGAAATEDVKTAAASALGGIVTGAGDSGVAWLKTALASAGDRSKYLLLAALKGVCARHAPLNPAGPAFEAHAGDAGLTALVEALAADADASVRAMAGEVLGRLAAAAPAVILPRIRALAADAAPARRAAAAVALKFAVASRAAVDNATVEAVLATALDDDISVKLVGLQAVHTTVNSSPRLVDALLRVEPPALDADGKSPKPAPPLAACGLQAVVFSDMQVRPELQREVDMGPFKQRVDDGLPLRKAAFGCLEAVFDRFRERLPPAVFVARLCDGLRDSDDVMILAHQLLAKAAVDAVFGRHVLANLPVVVDAAQAAFDKVMGRKKKSAEGGGSDVVRSALRVLAHIAEHCPEAGSVPAFAKAMDDAAAHAALGPMLASVRDTTGAAAAGASAGGAWR